ncbi:hypothetical protein [Helicobacter pylori]|uniref:hypothetical protein n=1 Tax=Helicobacter pylori TaxID=210 RepID=UPI0034677179
MYIFNWFLLRFSAVLVWGENLELLGFLVVAGGYLKKRCFIALFYRFSNGFIQTGFGHGRLKG